MWIMGRWNGIGVPNRPAIWLVNPNFTATLVGRHLLSDFLGLSLRISGSRCSFGSVFDHSPDIGSFWVGNVVVWHGQIEEFGMAVTTTP